MVFYGVSSEAFVFFGFFYEFIEVARCSIGFETSVFVELGEFPMCFFFHQFVRNRSGMRQDIAASETEEIIQYFSHRNVQPCPVFRMVEIHGDNPIQCVFVCHWKLFRNNVPSPALLFYRMPL